MRLLRFLWWLRQKKRPLSPDEKWAMIRRDLDRAPVTKPKEAIYDWKGCCKSCGRQKDGTVSML